MDIQAKLHYHDKTALHVEWFEDGVLKEHSCIARMNGHSNSPLISILVEKICHRWNIHDTLIKALKFCQQSIEEGDLSESDNIETMQQVIAVALESNRELIPYDNYHHNTRRIM